MKLFTKIMPVWQRYVYIGYRISSKYYSILEMDLVGTGQGKKFSVSLCRDTSCLIIRDIEKKNLGIKFIDLS